MNGKEKPRLPRLTGLIVALGIFFPLLTLTSFFVASLIFLGFLLGRIISTAADGKPNTQIIQGIVFEVVLGAANVYRVLNTLA
ncbi:MAG: DUF4345 family protein [Balneolales bacterium]|nr:DUF4345 family protein [Balneolales bacterium]